MTNREYIMNISVRDFINQFCLSVGYNEIDFVRLMILFKADDDRVNEWLDSEMIGSRKLTNDRHEANVLVVDDDGRHREWARFDECKEYRYELS